MIKISDPANCCGCTACASVCKHDAISMLPDKLGFLYPVVDESRCVECGICESVCQFNDDYDISSNFSQPYAFAARHKDLNEVMKSRSGAAFVAISDYILESGGVVYGAGYKDHFRVSHKRATTKEERDEFRGSKYVQSDLTGIFQRVKEDLNNGLTVLFSGTPCQTSGLSSFIGKRLRKNLVLVDIVCHGVPGPYIWRDFLNYIEKKHGSRIIKVNFRDKEKYGWKAHKETFEFEGGGEFSFTKLFYYHICFRKSCGKCHFCNLNRPSDITIADYWGWERTDPTFNADDKGCSLVLCNTEKGLQIFEAVKDKMNTIPADIANIMQNHLSHPSDMHPLRDDFERYYSRHGLKYAMKKTHVWNEESLILRIKVKIYNILKKLRIK